EPDPARCAWHTHVAALPARRQTLVGRTVDALLDTPVAARFPRVARRVVGSGDGADFLRPPRAASGTEERQQRLEVLSTDYRRRDGQGPVHPRGRLRSRLLEHLSVFGGARTAADPGALWRRLRARRAARL